MSLEHLGRYIYNWPESDSNPGGSLNSTRLAATLAAWSGATSLALLWSIGDYSGAAVIASVANAIMFLGIGALIPELAKQRSPHRKFKRFFGINSLPTEGSFWVVVPSFEPVDLQARYKNRELDGAEDTHIVIDEVTAKNDADASGLMASYVSGETNGVYQPMFTQDVNSSNLEDGRRHDRPAILFGLYSNRWLSDHWAMRRNRQIDCPIYGFDDGSQRGFLARTGSMDEAHYVDFLPEAADGSRIENFLDGSTRMAFDYLAIARMANSQLPETPWPWVLVTSIGPFGVRTALRHLVEQGVLTKVVEAHRGHQEFIAVFRVFLGAQETAPPQLIHEWPSATTAARQTYKRNGTNLVRLQ